MKNQHSKIKMTSFEEWLWNNVFEPSFILKEFKRRKRKGLITEKEVME